MQTAVEMEAEVRRLMQANNLRDAALACDQLNQQHPDFVQGWVVAASLALRVNEPGIAVRAIDRALQLAPASRLLLAQRIECLAAVGDLQAAISTAQQFDDYDFDSAAAASSFGLLLSRLQLHAQARRHFQRASELEPDNGEHYYNIATVQRFLGDKEAAEEAVNRCLELRPADADAHLLRAGLREQSRERNNIQSLLDGYKLTRNLRGDRSRICFALAKELEDIGEYERSFDYLTEGARLRREDSRYTPEDDLETMREIRRVYSADVFKEASAGHVSAEPIFVIGMPRTGTTLVERILGSHSVVRSAGELQTFAIELVKQCRATAQSPAATARELVAQSRNVDFAALGENYVEHARPPGGTAAHFVDKMPLNFLYAGLIHLALPKARIVLLERDPMDTCYAVYKAMFEGVYPYSYDLRELANYFVEYKRLVDHWQEVMPGVIHVVRYEEMVTSPEPVIESLLQYCSLSFEDACRNFFRNPEASTTASADSVRRDFFTSSVGKWRHYERQLKVVADVLESAG
jgi:tetratricopeptide (TPR) repeat protein